MSIHRARIVLVFACTVLPSMLAAQVVMPGARVRVVDVSSNNPLMAGELVRLVGDSVTISTASGLATPTVWVIGGQRRLEVRTALRTKATIGAVVGLVAGAAVGAAIGSSAPNNCGQSFAVCFPPATLGAFGGALVGTMIGGIVGHGLKSETWQQVDHHPVRVGIAPGPRGMLFTASMAF